MDTEVVITRKRKRQAVDPCLGYYQGIPPPNATKTNLKPLLPVTSHPYPSWSQATKNNVNAPTNVHEDLPTSPIQPAIERDLDHGERSLSPLPSSVEDFLKPTKKTVQRKYGQHARRVVLDSDDRNESAQDEDIPRSRSESPPPRKSKRLVKKSIQRDHENDDSDYQRQSPDDPCLGYYQGIPPLNATKAKPLLPVTSHPYPSWTQATKNNVPSHVIEDSPTSPIQPAIDDDLDYRERSVSPPPISVDDFLRQTKKTVRRKYGRHARRVVLDSDDRDAQEETSSRTRSEIPPPRNSTRLAKKKRIQLDLGSDDSDYQPQSPDESSSSESTPVKRKVTKVPLSKLLFTAAVLSNAHPMDSLAAGSSKEKVQRKPLRFQRPPSPSPPQKLYNLTDPRKTHPFDGSSFASKSSKISQRPCKPINTWVTPHSKLPPPPPGSKPFKPKLPASGPSVAASQPVRRRLVMIPASQAPPDRVRVRSQLTHSAKPPLPGTRIPLQFQECPLV